MNEVFYWPKEDRIVLLMAIIQRTVDFVQFEYFNLDGTEELDHSCLSPHDWGMVYLGNLQHQLFQREKNNAD